MKVFKFCNKQLTYVPFSVGFYSKLTLICTCVVIILSLTLSYFFTNYYQTYKKIRVNKELEVLILNEHNKFDKIKMLNYMKEINIKFPYIVYAQAILESNNFTSKIFKENNNCFGMKVATARQSTNIGEQYEHAVFDTWKDCVIDYALYQARYLNSIKTEEQYFQYLQNSYAEDTSYVNKLRTIINKKKLK